MENAMPTKTGVEETPIFLKSELPRLMRSGKITQKQRDAIQEIWDTAGPTEASIALSEILRQTTDGA
jgi:hypothetical protein